MEEHICFLFNAWRVYHIIKLKVTDIHYECKSLIMYISNLTFISWMSSEYSRLTIIAIWNNEDYITYHSHFKGKFTWSWPQITRATLIITIAILNKGAPGYKMKDVGY